MCIHWSGFVRFHQELSRLKTRLELISSDPSIEILRFQYSFYCGLTLRIGERIGERICVIGERFIERCKELSNLVATHLVELRLISCLSSESE